MSLIKYVKIPTVNYKKNCLLSYMYIANQETNFKYP